MAVGKKIAGIPRVLTDQTVEMDEADHEKMRGVVITLMKIAKRLREEDPEAFKKLHETCEQKVARHDSN